MSVLSLTLKSGVVLVDSFASYAEARAAAKAAQQLLKDLVGYEISPAPSV